MIKVGIAPIIIFLQSDTSLGAWRARGIRAFGAQENALLMGSLAHAFYLLSDLKRPIRSNARRPCYFLSDPSI
jgi:hypothetical protein